MPLNKSDIRSPRIHSGILLMLQKQLLEDGKGGAVYASDPPDPPVADEQGYLALPELLAYLHSLCEHTGDLCFILRAVTQFGPQDIGHLGYLIFSSDTLRTALSSVERFIRLQIEETTVRLQEENGVARLEYSLNILDMPGKREDEIASIGMAARLLTLLRGQAPGYHTVEFPHPRPAQAEAIEQWFACPVRYNCKAAALLFDAAILDEPLPLANPGLNSTLLSHAERQLSMTSQDSLVSDIMRFINQRLGHGVPEISDVSRHCGLSIRTLQRRLSERALSYHKLVDNIRRELALIYISEPELPLSEIVFLLGYSEFSAFGRAFKRWTGKTPSEYRKP